VQVRKQKDSFSNYCKSNDELNIVKSIFSERQNTIEDLIDVLAKWRWMAGIGTYNQSEDDVAKELVLLSQFILKNYPNINIDEISLAIDLSLTDKLDVDVRAFNNFSPMYVSRILNSYKDYKLRLFKNIQERKNKEEDKILMEKNVSPKEKMDNMIDLIRYFYDKFKSDGFIDDHFNTLYNYFRRTNKLNPNKDIVNQAIEYGRIRANEYISSYFDALSKDKPNKESIEKRYARNYCVQIFFESLNLEDFISKIQISEFE
jgi:hypothetical protein